MNERFLARLGGIMVAALIFLSAAQGVDAQGSIGGTNVWTVVGTPTFSTGAAGPQAAINFSNTQTSTVNGVVVMVLRNSAGQTVYFTTGTLTLTSGQVGAAYLIVFGQSPGTYNATFFAMTFGGVAISLPVAASFTQT